MGRTPQTIDKFGRISLALINFYPCLQTASSLKDTFLPESTEETVTKNLGLTFLVTF